MTQVFRNARIPAGGDATRLVDMQVAEERFARFDEPGFPCSADARVVDLAGALVLPGVIDAHVHFDDPGYTWRETFATGTRAAAAGGVTCVADMPCTSVPPVIGRAALEAKLAVVSPKAHVDFCFWGGICANLMEDGGDWRGGLADLAACGVAAIKCYLLSGMKSFRALSPGQLRDAATTCRDIGLPLGVHAEDRDFVMMREGELRQAGWDDARAYVASRPGEAERLAAATVAEAALSTGARLHVVHLGSGEALALLKAAVQRGARLTTETCPHYLAFTADDFQRLGSVLKTAPPVKAAADRDALWRGVIDGSIAFVTTDHAAGEWPREKCTGSFWNDYGGIPGVELLLPWLFTTGVGEGRITLERLVELLSAGPARFLGVSRRKGALAPGMDADFVVLDDRLPWLARAESMHCLNRYTPFDGMTMRARVRQTWVRGRLVHDGDEDCFPAGPGWGRFVPRGERDHG